MSEPGGPQGARGTPGSQARCQVWLAQYYASASAGGRSPVRCISRPVLVR